MRSLLFLLIAAQAMQAQFLGVPPWGPNGASVAQLPAPTVLWYKFNEGSGTTLIDYSGNGNNATLTGSPSWGTGYGNGYLVLNGSTQYGTSQSVCAITSTKGTISVWVQPNPAGLTGGYNRILENAYTNSVYLGTDTTSTKFEAIFGSSTATGTTSSSTFVNGVWVHVAATFSGTVATIYTNGVATGTPATAGTNFCSVDDKFYIGTFNPTLGGTLWYGNITALKLWTNVFTAAQIGQLYTNGPAY